MAEIPISLLVWGGLWLLLLLVAIVLELRSDAIAQGEVASSEVEVSPEASRESPSDSPTAATPPPETPSDSTPVAPVAVPGEPAEGTDENPFTQGLRKTQGALAARLRTVFSVRGEDKELYEELEELLIASDVGVGPAGRLVLGVRQAVPAGADAQLLAQALRSQIRGLLGDPVPEPTAFAKRPWVQLVVGVNGVGKTTSIGKLAARHTAAGRKVLLVAGDTFRAAAGDQLAIWAERAGADIVQQATGADPAAVAFDGLQAAQARDVDVVIVDTAGRLHTKVNLMEELRKVSRILGRVVPDAPHEVLLVLDATTGQNALAQARAFSEIVPITGVILTKLDGSARGGMTIAVRYELDAPVRYVGLGEGASDLRVFDPDAFVEGLLPENDAPLA